MSKGELWKGVAISAIIGIVFGLIGYFAINYALQMVGIYGEGLGVDERSRWIYAQSHKVVHLFAAACGLAIGWFHHRRNWTLFGVALAAVLFCGGYGILNMYGFTSTNRVTVSASKDAKKNAAERDYQNARADLQGQIDWLKATAGKEEGRERRRLLAEVDAKRQELSSLKAPIPGIDTIVSDPQASTLAKLTGLTAEQWALIVPLLLAVLLFFAESFSFIVVGHMLAAIVAMFASYSATKGRKLAGSSEGGGGKVKSSEESKPATVAERGDNVVDLPARVAEPAQLQAAQLPKVSSEPARVQQPAPTVSLTLQQPKYASVEEFLAANPSVSKQKDIATGMKVSEAKVSRDVQRLKGRGKVKSDRNGRSNAVTYTPRRDRGLHAIL